MNDIRLVDVIDALADLLDDGRHLFLLHPVGLPQSLQQLSPSAKLDQQIDCRFVFEIAIKRGNIPML